MIVDPDFLDHWRTRMLVDALGGDEFAPMYVMRLWAHCQVRRGDTFSIPAAGIKALCKATGDATKIEAALIEAQFIKRDGEQIEVMGWAEHNASLLAAWDNGHKGGRPRKEPKQNPRVTNQKPTDNPDETHGEPNENPSLTQTKPRREEKRREETTASAVVSAGKPALLPRGTRIPVGWALPKPWGEWAQLEYPHWSAETVRLIGATFGDHWRAKSGKDGVKSDWEATWRNWCRGDITQRAHPPPGAGRMNGNHIGRQQAVENHNRAVGEQWLRDQEAQDANH